MFCNLRFVYEIKMTNDSFIEEYRLEDCMVPVNEDLYKEIQEKLRLPLAMNWHRDIEDVVPIQPTQFYGHYGRSGNVGYRFGDYEETLKRIDAMIKSAKGDLKSLTEMAKNE